MLIKVTCGLSAVFGLLAVGEIPAMGEFGIVAQLGSAGVLLWVVKILVKFVNDSRDDLLSEIKASREERQAARVEQTENNKALSDAIGSLRESVVKLCERHEK